MKPEGNKEGSPLFGNWKKFYLAVVIWLVFLILIFKYITDVFS